MTIDYLVVPAEYVKELGGIKWSSTGDALEDRDGGTFAMAPEVFAFIEGFASNTPLMHFGHILHFMYLLRHGKTVRHDLGALGRAWREAGRPARTAGVLAARLCREVPPLPEPPQLEHISRWMTLSILMGPLSAVGTEPPLDVETFEALVTCQLENYSFGDLVHWFRHGTAVVKNQGEELVRQLLAHKPRTLAQTLAEVSQHERLQGAMPFVERLISAFSLPPRRLFQRELPMGGYSDVCNRGQPDQLLPSQFALDELEFLRRHAENELLYYRREEPATRTREELVLLLDQGVRTWGRVRLALTAAVFSLAEYAQKRQLGLRIATTGNGGHPIDPLEVPTSELAHVLGQSDFTVQPALALETLLEQPCDRERDIVLITHPRSLLSSEITAAARRLHTMPRRAAHGTATRLFSLSMDASGEAALAQWQHGGAIPMTRFRLDLGSAAAPISGRTPLSSAIWSGSVEVVPYPFRFGLANHVERPLFAIDHAGTRLLLSGQDGQLFAVHLNGSGYEVLPRPVLASGDEANPTVAILTDIHAIQGVEGGFAVLLASRNADNKPMLLVAHYDFYSRHCQLYRFPFVLHRGVFRAELRYCRRLHMLLVRCNDKFNGILLSTRQTTLSVPHELLWSDSDIGSDSLPWQENDQTQKPTTAWCHPRLIHDKTTGQLSIVDANRNWQPFIPKKDGLPLFKNQQLRQAICRGNVLVVVTSGRTGRDELFVFQGPTGELMDVMGIPQPQAEVQLSADGQYLAVPRTMNQLQIRRVQPGLPIAVSTPVGRFHNNQRVAVNAGSLMIVYDQTTHWLWWTDGVLHHVMHPEQPSQITEGPTTLARSGSPAFLRHGGRRFIRSAQSKLTAVLSCHGEIFLFTELGLLVCGFFAYKQQVAAWLPDGTYFGPETLTGQTPTVDAAKRIGQALLAAQEGRKP